MHRTGTEKRELMPLIWLQIEMAKHHEEERIEKRKMEAQHEHSP
jgi:hypothetical protein